MIPDFSGNYLNYESTKDGDTITILDEGKVEFNDVLKKDMFNLTVQRSDKKMIYSPTNKVGKVLQEAFGEDTKEWVNKQFTVIHIDKRMHVKPITE